MNREMQMTTFARILAAAALAALPAWAGGIAFVSDVKGGVQLDAAPVKLLAELPAGARLRVPADGQVAVMYIESGREYVLRGPGEYELRAGEVAAASGAAPQARATPWRASNQVLAQVSQTSAASVRMRSMARPGDARPVAYPAEGSIASLQPMFRWAEAAPAGAEFVLVADGQAQPVHTGKASGTAYRLPAKLKPDTDYYWRVSAPSGDLASGRFRTLAGEALRTIEARRPVAKAGFSDRLLFALLLEEMGARQEARELWTALAQERADLPELAALAK